MLSPYPFTSSSANEPPNRVVSISDQIIGTHLSTYSTPSTPSQSTALSGLPQPVTLLIVTTKTAITVYHPKDRTCLKSWQLLDDANRPVRLHGMARFVHGVNAVIVGIRDGTALAKLGFELPSGAHKVGALALLAPPVATTRLLVESSLASVVAMVGRDASLTLMDVSEEQNTSVIVPREEGDVEVDVGFAEIVRPDVLKPMWVVCMLLARSGKGNGVKICLRRVKLQQSKGMLSLLKVDDCEVVDEELVGMLNGVEGGSKTFAMVASLVVFSEEKIAMCLTDGKIVEVSFNADEPNTLSWTLMTTSSSALNAATPLAGSKQLLCYVDGDSNEAKCFDVGFQMDRSSSAQLEVSESKSVRDVMRKEGREQRSFVQSVNATAGVASVCVTRSDGSIMMYDVPLGGNSLAASLGQLRNEDSPVHVIVNKNMLSDTKPDCWGDFMSSEASSEKSKLKELEECGSDSGKFTKLLKGNLRVKHMVSMSFVEQAIKISVERKVWSGLQLLVEQNCVPCTRNRDILSAAMSAQELGLLYSAIRSLTDIPEADLVNVLAFVLSSADTTALGKFATHIDAKILKSSEKQTRKRKRKALSEPATDSSTTFGLLLKNRIDGLSEAERGQLYLLSAIMCVSCNQRFIVSALGKLDATAAEVLLSFAAHLLFVYDSVQASLLYEAEKRSDGSHRSPPAVANKAVLPIPSREVCIQWCLYLFDGKLREVVRSGANSEAFRDLLVALQEVCERNAACCERAQNLLEPLKECLKRNNGTFSVMFKSKPSGYCVEYLRI